MDETRRFALETTSIELRDRAKAIEWALASADDLSANAKTTVETFFSSMDASIVSGEEDEIIARKARLYTAGVAWKKAAYRLQIEAAKYEQLPKDNATELFFAMHALIRAVCDFQDEERDLTRVMESQKA